jgi:aminoglycoside phosphotransferase
LIDIDADDFDEERAGRSPASLLDELHATRPPDEELVLIHGDYCFPNVVIKGWALSGFIDLGRCGVADRYHDLAQAARSVRRNLGGRAGWRRSSPPTASASPTRRSCATTSCSTSSSSQLGPL